VLVELTLNLKEENKKKPTWTYFKDPLFIKKWNQQVTKKLPMFPKFFQFSWSMCPSEKKKALCVCGAFSSLLLGRLVGESSFGGEGRGEEGR